MDQKDRELLIRIDERTNTFHQSLGRFELTLATKVDNDSNYKEMSDRVKAMWDLKNRAMGYIAAWTAVIAITAASIFEVVREFVFKK